MTHGDGFSDTTGSGDVSEAPEARDGGPVVSYPHMALRAYSSLPLELEPLAKDLAALPPATRAAVVVEAERLANERHPVASWQSVTALGAIVSLGGDALSDTASLYDG